MKRTGERTVAGRLAAAFLNLFLSSSLGFKRGNWKQEARIGEHVTARLGSSLSERSLDPACRLQQTPATQVETMLDGSMDGR